MNTMVVNGKARGMGALRARGPSKLPVLGGGSKATNAATNGANTSLLDKIGPCRDQTTLGACMSFMMSKIAFEYLHRLGPADPRPSELASYYWAREIGGLPLDQDTGNTMDDVVQAGIQKGFALDADWPYDPSKFAIAPPPEAEARAAEYRIQFPFQLPSVDTMLACIDQGFPFGLCIELTESFETVGPDGIYVPSGADVGGHGVIAVAYDLEEIIDGFTGSLTCQNQWGFDWGDNGLFKVGLNKVEDGTITCGTTVRRTSNL